MCVKKGRSKNRDYRCRTKQEIGVTVTILVRLVRDLNCFHREPPCVRPLVTILVRLVRDLNVRITGMRFSAMQVTILVRLVRDLNQ